MLECIVFFAVILHSGVKKMKKTNKKKFNIGKSLLLAVVAYFVFSAFFGVFRQIGIDFEGLSYTPIINDTTLQNYFCELISIYSTHNTNMRVAKVNQVLLKMLIYLTENYSAQKNSPPAENRHFEKVKETVTFIQQNYNRKITLDEISKVVLYDKFALCKIFKTLTGQTITENLNRYRSLRAIDLLSEGYTISETAFMCGFNNLSFFTKTFKKYVGKNPSNYKKKKPDFLQKVYDIKL